MILVTAPETWPFGAALAVMVGLAVIEGAGLLFAASPSMWLDNLLPDMADGLDGPLGWLHLGRVPLLVLFILFLAGFSVAGYVVQAVVQGATGALLPAWLASIPAFLAGMSTLSGVGAVLAQLIPRDETSAVSEHSLIGRAGVIVHGTATPGLAAQAKVRDVNGHAHYVMVEPDIPEHSFSEGSGILLVRKTGARYRCIANPHPELL